MNQVQRHPPTIVRHGKVDAAVNSAKRFLRKTAAVTRLPGVSCWAQYSITRHREQSNSETHEQEDEDSSSHNWQSAGAKEPEHKPRERQTERCAKTGKLILSSILVLMTYSCTHLKRGIRDTVRIKPYSFRGKRNGRMGWSWKDLMIERSYKVETADGSS